jgi:piezo-type mechanosensitive ion channel component 1/2
VGEVGSQVQKMQPKRLGQTVKQAFVAQFTVAVFFVVLANLCHNNDLLSLLPVLMFLFYGLLEHPFIPSKFWRILLAYEILVLSLKFLYQLPFFCESPPYQLTFLGTCDNEEKSVSELLHRIDFIIGIRKYGGQASYPRDTGIFRGVLWDLLLLVSVLIQRSLMQENGSWASLSFSRSTDFYPQYAPKIHHSDT